MELIILYIATVLTTCGLSSLAGTIDEASVARGLGRRGRAARTGVLTNATPPGLLNAWFNNLGGACRLGVP